MNDSVAPARGVPSRRTVLAGAAWSVPVIAVAAAAPQAAASGPNQIEWAPGTGQVSLVQGGLKIYLQARGFPSFQNPSISTVTPTVVVTNTNNPSDTFTKSFPSQLLSVPAGWGVASNQEELVMSNLTCGQTYSVTVTAVVANANNLPALALQATAITWC